jgi:hypothetical protein
LILSIERAIIKACPIGKKAEAADRAFEKMKRIEPREFAPHLQTVGQMQNGSRSEVPPTSPRVDVDDDN